MFYLENTMSTYFRFFNMNWNKAGFGNLRAMIRFIIMVLAIACFLVGMNPSNAFAAGITYYVDNTNGSCSDAGSGTTSAVPFCKIAKGASAAAAGDTVQVLAGSYAETVTVPKSGSTGLPITYSAAPGVTVTGAASYGFRVSGRSYITIDGFSVTGTSNIGISVATSDHIIISNNNVGLSGSPVNGSARAGINFDATTNSTISGNALDHNSSYGIYLSGGSSGNTVSDNISFANASGYVRIANGINVYASNNNTILHNITYGNEDSGIQLYSGSTGNLVIGNLTYGNADHGIDLNASPNNIIVGNTVQGNYTSGINVEGASGGVTIANNIAVDNGINIVGSGQPGNIRVDASSIVGSTINFDIVLLTGVGTSQIQWNGTNYATLAAFKAAVPTQEVNGLQANPLFIAPVTPAVRPNGGNGGLPAVNVGDYHIAAGSPAIDSANSNAPSEPLLDIEGYSRVDDPATTDTGAGVRTYDDRGAYEFQPLSGGITNTPKPATPTPTATLISINTPTDTPLPPTATFTATPGSGSGSTLTFLANADSYVREASVNANYGTNVQLWVAYGLNASYESYLKFTISGVSGSVQSATLRVYSTSSTVDGPAVYTTNTNWTETGITWATRPARISGAMDDKGAIAAGVWVEYNVLPIITGDGSYSFALVSTSTDSVSFSTHEGSQPPQLVIVTTTGALVTNTPTDTALPSTATFTPTYTPLPPTPTVTPTDTALPPTATFTPTYTALLPTATFTSTDTAVPPTATFTLTNTALPLTATFTPTNTALLPTVTFTPTSTALPPTATFTPIATFTPTSTLASATNTGFHAPTANSAVTTSAGDNNGYQTTPTNAYLADGLFAIDANSGTNSNTSCTNSGKDKHLFYNYTLNVPTAATIQGIEVKLTGKVSSASNSPKFCVQLSWDGGTTWTTAKSTSVLSITNTTYLLGTSLDTWGRTWSGLNFSDANFRLRIIDVAGSSSRTFYLDGVAVQVTYK
jgi:parallel beta-helix repeat protein